MAFDVFGMCNALYDIQAEVDDSVLRELGLDKGAMILADHEQQRAIAERRDDAWIVTDDDHRVAERSQLPVPLFAAGLEARVADGEDLVEHQHLAHRFERHGVAEPG